MTDTPTPKRSVYKAAEVCEIARLQPYVLRTWEAEFTNLGVARPGGVRVYRQADLDRVMRIKRLVIDEGLTLAGVRRRLESEDAPQPELPLEELFAPAARERIRYIREQLQEIFALLTREHGQQPAAALSSDGSLPPGSEAAAPTEPTNQVTGVAEAAAAQLPEGAAAGTAPTTLRLPPRRGDPHERERS